MIAVPARTLLAALLLALSFCSCSGGGHSSFPREAQWLQANWSGDAELIRTDAPRKDANAVQEIWAYQFAGGRDAAMKFFRNHIPAGYTLVRQADSDLSLAKFDGHDSYQLTLTFEASTRETTTVLIVLKSFPD